MFVRSSAENRAITPLISSMKCGSSPAPVHGLRGSSRVARRPSVKSTDTRAAPAANAWRMSFSHSSTSVRLELLAAVALHRVLQRVQQRQHRRRDHGLLHRLGRVADRLAQRVGRVLVVRRTGRCTQLGQLPAVAVGEDREELPARARASARGRCPRACWRSGRSRSSTSAAHRRRRSATPVASISLDRVLGRRVLQLLELGLLDLARVELRVGLLELRRSRQRADRSPWGCRCRCGDRSRPCASAPDVGCVPVRGAARRDTG